jgi:hypothetical protein
MRGGGAGEYADMDGEGRQYAEMDTGEQQARARYYGNGHGGGGGVSQIF